MFSIKYTVYTMPVKSLDSLEWESVQTFDWHCMFRWVVIFRLLEQSWLHVILNLNISDFQMSLCQWALTPANRRSCNYLPTESWKSNAPSIHVSLNLKQEISRCPQHAKIQYNKIFLYFFRSMGTSKYFGLISYCSRIHYMTVTTHFWIQYQQILPFLSR